jgi:cytochrome c oxidase cbb3-type subunit III
MRNTLAVTGPLFVWMLALSAAPTANPTPQPTPQTPRPAAGTPPAPTSPAGQPAPRPPAPAPGGGGFAASYPQRPPGNPEAIARGKTLYGVACAFCHGSDARGGETGPNLLRSQLVLNDQDGELIAPVVQNGRPERGMPPMAMTLAQVKDIATFVHSFKVGGYDISRMTPPSIVVGDAKAGQAYFNATCASCHSITGDLKGFGAKFTDHKLLQQSWLMPGSGRGFGGFGPPAGPSPVRVSPTMVSVTLASGETMQGRLGRIDDFIVTLTTADGTFRSFRRVGDTPRVVVTDPLAPHKALLPKYTDKDIHDLTAWLVTVK